jgi:hypothetical protein
VKIGDLVRGSETNIKPQRNSVALIVDQDPIDGSLSIFWISGVIKGTRVCHNFSPDELEVISEGR